MLSYSIIIDVGLFIFVSPSIFVNEKLKKNWHGSNNE